jgi:hypothetical protein
VMPIRSYAHVWILALVVLFAHGSEAAPAPPALPAPPSQYIDTTYSAPTGQRIAVRAGGDFQAALNAAQPGDVILLEPGTQFRGNFRLPRKPGSDFIHIRPDLPDSALPPPGHRMTPALAGSLPKLVTPNGAQILSAEPGAHHYRFIGIEFAVDPAVPVAHSMVFFDGSASDIVFDRCYVHGHPRGNVQRGITFNGSRMAVVDSYVSEIHWQGVETQAVGAWDGPGPFKLVNNYLEAAGVNVMFGGAAPATRDVTPSDIEVRRNYFFKPWSWKVGHPSYAGIPWTVKNLFELKHAQRVLIEGNLFENSWFHAQFGYAILMTVVNEQGGGLGTAPWTTIRDVSFVNNHVRHAAGGFQISGQDHMFGSRVMQRILIANNLLEYIDIEYGYSAGKDPAALNMGFAISNGPQDLVIDHNTMVPGGRGVRFGIRADFGVFPRFTFRNNILPMGWGGVSGDCCSTAAHVMATHAPDGIMTNNLFLGTRQAASSFPRGNFVDGKAPFIDAASGNYRLAPNSRYKGAATDGKDIGVDVDALAGALGTTPDKRQ